MSRGLERERERKIEIQGWRRDTKMEDSVRKWRDREKCIFTEIRHKGRREPKRGR